MVGSVGLGGLLPSLSGLGGQNAPSFDQIDTDNDGTISLEEFKAAAKNLPSQAESADNGKAEELFATIDTDGDGAISKDEATAFTSKVSSAIQAVMILFQQESQAGDAATTADTNADATATSRADRLFAKLDADGDGSISKDEFTAAFNNRRHHAHEASESGESGGRVSRLFDKIDADGDGEITKEENQAFVDSMRGRHHHGHAWKCRMASQCYTDTAAVTSTETSTSATTTEDQTV